MYNDKVKEAQYRWIEKNREHFNAICRANMKKYHETHKSELNKKCLGRYYLKKEMEIFRKILI